MNKRRLFWTLLFLGFAGFLAHRLTMELRFFNVTTEFERPMALAIPKGLESLRASDCGVCHREIYEEWKTSMHANSWTDPYFQVDYQYDGAQQICLNCHTPLENQQENLVKGFHDKEKFYPVLEANPGFDPSFRDEGITCAVCHVKEGKVMGPYGIETAAHPVEKDIRLADGNGICRRCHLVHTNRWDTFLRSPLCGTFSEIESMAKGEEGKEPDCQKCHMEKVVRPTAPGGPERPGGSHLWRGGHDPEKVKNALAIKLEETGFRPGRKKEYALSITNTGAEHRIPTGIPDRHLKMVFRLLDGKGRVLEEKKHFLQRIILWRPVMLDVWDGRLRYGETQSYSFSFNMDEEAGGPAALEAEVWYGLLREERRKKIGYENKDPIQYRVFYERVDLLLRAKALLN